jgi:hypothetical protein
LTPIILEKLASRERLLKHHNQKPAITKENFEKILAENSPNVKAKSNRNEPKMLPLILRRPDHMSKTMKNKIRMVVQIDKRSGDWTRHTKEDEEKEKRLNET